uniref:Ubiquitin-like domain-containing protein n=1 Tax=Myotis lucifugus TaxID=59463 RepID=G1QE47_MYOLU
VLVDLVSDSDEEILEGSADRSKSRSRSPQCGSRPPPPNRDDNDSDSDGAAGAPPTLARRRRLLGQGEAPAVHPEKVKSSRQLIPDHLPLLKLCPRGSPRWGPPGPDPPWKQQPRSKAVSPSQDTSPLPSPLPGTKSRKHTGALHPEGQRGEHTPPAPSFPPESQAAPGPGHLSRDEEAALAEGPIPRSPRLFQLPVRRRAGPIRLPVPMSEPQGVVGPMATLLGVSPGRILLFFGETELSPATPRTLQLGAAIIGCVVPASAPRRQRPLRLQLRLQGEEKHQALQGWLSRDSPKTLMSHYTEAMGLSGHKLSFFIDGTQLSGKELPADLGMESGDLMRSGA